MKYLKIRAVLFTDGEHYFIHGNDSETPAEMFKTMLPIWNFDPSTENAEMVEFMVEISDTPKTELVACKIYIPPTTKKEPFSDFDPNEDELKPSHSHEDLPLTLAKEDPIVDNRMGLTLNDCKLG